jgi:hypothetical protein
VLICAHREYPATGALIVTSDLDFELECVSDIWKV